MNFKNIIAFAFLLIGSCVFGQSTGMITMEITEASSKDAQTNGMLQMLIGSQTKIVFTDKKQAIDMDIMNGMVKMKMITDKGIQERNILVDMMGQKVWTVSTLSEKSTVDASNFEVTYDKANKKNILGYDCYGFSINLKEDPDMKVSGYLTEKISTIENIMQGVSNVKIAGTPLEYSIISDDVSMKLTAKVASDKIADASVLDLKTDGYSKMTAEEFKQLLGPAADMFKF